MQAGIAGAAMLFALQAISALAAAGTAGVSSVRLAIPGDRYGWLTAINGEVGVRNLPAPSAHRLPGSDCQVVIKPWPSGWRYVRLRRSTSQPPSRLPKA